MNFGWEKNEFGFAFRHAQLYLADDPTKLSATALAALEDENNRLFLSDASIWEMQIKVQLGKMKLKLPLKDLIESQQRDNEVEIYQLQPNIF